MFSCSKQTRYCNGKHKKAIELDPECLYELEYYEEFNKLMERNDFKLLYK